MEDFIFTGEDLLNSILYVNENKTTDKNSPNSQRREYSLGILRGNGKQRIGTVSKRLAHTLFTLSTNEACLDLLSEEFKQTNEFHKPMDFFEKYITTDSFPSQGDKVVLKLPITEFSIRNRSIAFIIYMLTSFYHINKLHNYIALVDNEVIKIKNNQIYDKYIDDLLLCTILSTLNIIINSSDNKNNDYRDKIAEVYNNNLGIYKKLLSNSEENISNQTLISIDKEYRANNLFESIIVHNQMNDAVKTLKLSSKFSNLSQIEIENILYIIKFLFIGKLLDIENDKDLKNIISVSKNSVIRQEHTLGEIIDTLYYEKEEFCDYLTDTNNESLKILEKLLDNYSVSFYPNESYSILKNNIANSINAMKNYKPKIEELKRLINAIDKYQSDFDKINIPGYLHIMSFYNLNRLIQDIEPVIELLAKMNNTISKLKKTISQLELTKIPVQANNLIKKLKNNWDKYTSTLTEFKIEFDTIFLPLLGFNSDNNLKKIPLFDNELSKVAAKGMFENYENWNILTPTRNTLHEVEEKYKKIVADHYKTEITKESGITIYKKLVDIEDYISQFHIVYYNKYINTYYNNLIKTAKLPYLDYIIFFKSEIPNLKFK
jgi:hypothetical protein